MVENVLCVGVSLSPWGGSYRLKPSCLDTVTAAVLGDAETSHQESPQFEAVDLRPAPNPEATEFHGANYDARGELFAAAVAALLERHAGRFDRVILALDAPLAARPRPGQPPRAKAHFPGRRSAFLQRQPENEIHAARQRFGATKKSWNRDLMIQGGSPLLPRVEQIVACLRQELGFELFDPKSADARPARQLIEVLPTEAVWWLGVAGYYGNSSSQEIRWYKAGKWKELGSEPAASLARRPFKGFSALFHERLPEHSEGLTRWLERVALQATFEALHPRSGKVKRRHKRYDDVLESGLALATAASFAGGCFHHWGDGEDGVIVGPGPFADGEPGTPAAK